jgi:hypothetical protein
MLKQARHLTKSRPQIHELGITGPGIISQFADLLLLPGRHRLSDARHVAWAASG